MKNAAMPNAPIAVRPMKCGSRSSHLNARSVLATLLCARCGAAQVAHDRARHDDRRATAQALQEAEGDQPAMSGASAQPMLPITKRAMPTYSGGLRQKMSEAGP